LRIKPRKRLIREKPEALTVPLKINQVWSMDFMHDQLEDGRTFRLFNVIDDYNREAIGMEAYFSLPAERVIRELKQMISWRGKPLVIRCDNGPEYISAAIQTWVAEWGIRLEYIQPGNPKQNASVERFNRTVGYECLSQYYWSSWVLARETLRTFRSKLTATICYNNETSLSLGVLYLLRSRSHARARSALFNYTIQI